MMQSLYPYLFKRLVVLKETESAQVAACAMRERDVGSILCVNARGHVTGILTDRDLACRVVADLDSTDVPISAIMSRQLITVRLGASVSEVVELMLQYGIRRVPVVDERRKHLLKFIGMVSLDDLILHELITLREASKVIGRQIGDRRLRQFTSSRAAMRSEAHARQSSEKFYRDFSRELRLSLNISTAVFDIIMGALLRRLNYGGARHLIAQLPRNIQERLKALPVGPDRSISSIWIQDELMARFGFSEDQAFILIGTALQAIAKLTSPGLMARVFTQLPEEFKEYMRLDEQQEKTTNGKAADSDSMPVRL